MNKYGGIADISCDKRIYNLWYQMLRRCYDAEQHKRTRGSSYSDCEVSDNRIAKMDEKDGENDAAQP